MKDSKLLLFSTFVGATRFLQMGLLLALINSCSTSGPRDVALELDRPTVEIVADKVSIGKFESRALLRRLRDLSEAQAMVILLPGSGAHGPEEMLPANTSGNMKDVAFFNVIASTLNRAGFSTLQLGKPGVNYFKSWDPKKKFYDAEMYQQLKWADLLENTREAIRWARKQPWVDSEKIFLLGHSEGTQVAVDLARLGENLKGLILLGYQGRSIKNILEYQLYQREIEWVVARDVDVNRDGKVSIEEDRKSLIFSWNWQEGETEISYQQIENFNREQSERKKFFNEYMALTLFETPFDADKDIFQSTAALNVPILVMTGELDVQTPAADTEKLQQMCETFKKSDCYIHVIAGVGHGFSEPRGPRQHPLLDMTLGPPEPRFLNKLEQFSAALK